MKDSHQLRVPCLICHNTKAVSRCASVRSLRQELADHIAASHPADFAPDGYVCQTCLDAERVGQLAAELEKERGELSVLEADVSARAALHSARAEHIGDMFDQKLTLGQRVADRVAAVGGSWPFVIGFGVVLAVWIGINTYARGDSFDPYPFILLNLVLSCLAAIQAPVIMMSQNRASARDRLQADEDFKVNLKAELEVGLLHDKMDHLLHVQWERMVTMQQAQIELLEELAAARSQRSRPTDD